MKNLIVYLLILVGNTVCASNNKIIAMPTPKVLGIGAFINLMPGPTPPLDNPVSISLDIRECSKNAVSAIRAINLRTGEVWDGKMEFTYYLENQNPERGQRYHSVHPGPLWNVGDEIFIFVQANGKWINAGKTIIGAVY